MRRSERTPAATDGQTGAGEKPSLVRLLREDWIAHERKWHRPGLHAVVVYRLGAWSRSLPRPFRYPFALIHGALYLVTRNLYGIELPASAKVGRRFVIGHQSGIVIGEGVEIGDDCTIRQNVTIGAMVSRGPLPRIGNRVEIGAGAVITGGVDVADGAVIGPNAVVTQDIPPGARVVARPPLVVSPATSEDARPRRDLPAVPPLDDLIELIRETLELEAAPAADTPLISSGLVDSLKVVLLVTALEEAYGIQVATEEIDAETFDTPTQMHAVIESSLQRS